MQLRLRILPSPCGARRHLRVAVVASISTSPPALWPWSWRRPCGMGSSSCCATRHRQRLMRHRRRRAKLGAVDSNSGQLPGVAIVITKPLPPRAEPSPAAWDHRATIRAPVHRDVLSGSATRRVHPGIASWGSSGCHAGDRKGAALRLSRAGRAR
jgi:hypothetical protein